MDSHVQDRAAAGHLGIVEPVGLRPAGIWAGVGETDVNHVGLPDLAGQDRVTGGNRQRVETVGETDCQTAACALLGGLDGLRLLHGYRNGLLKDDVTPALHRLNRITGMILVRKTNRNQVGTLLLKKLRTVGILMLKVPLLPDAGQGRRKYVRYRSQLAVLVRGIPRNVGGAGNRTTTQYTNSQLLHGQIPSC